MCFGTTAAPKGAMRVSAGAETCAVESFLGCTACLSNESNFLRQPEPGLSVMQCNP